MKEEIKEGLTKTADGKVVKAIRDLEVLKEEKKVTYTKLEVAQMKKE